MRIESYDYWTFSKERCRFYDSIDDLPTEPVSMYGLIFEVWGLDLVVEFKNFVNFFEPEPAVVFLRFAIEAASTCWDSDIVWTKGDLFLLLAEDFIDQIKLIL